MKKAIISFIALIAGILVVDYLKLQDSCHSTACREAVDGILFGWLLISVACLLIILFLKRLPKEVSAAWWKFARWAVPIVFVLSTLINSGIHHSQNGQLQNIFDMPALILLYSTFIIGSIVQIVRGYRSVKGLDSQK